MKRSFVVLVVAAGVLCAGCVSTTPDFRQVVSEPKAAVPPSEVRIRRAGSPAFPFSSGVPKGTSAAMGRKCGFRRKARIMLATAVLTPLMMPAPW